MKPKTPQKRKVFISYSHKDEGWKDQLLNQLRTASSEGGFEIWDDRRIQAGDEWYKEIVQAIGQSSLAILLISADFLNSKFIKEDEVPRLLQEREKRGMRLFPVIARDCPWKKVDWLSRLQARPLDGMALSQRKGKREAVLAKIAEEVWELLDQMEVERLSSRTLQFLKVYRKRLEQAFSRWDNLGIAGEIQRPDENPRSDALLDDMYLPLRLDKGFDLTKTDRGEPFQPEDLLERQKPLVLRGPAGTGKTTWMRWTYRRLLGQNNAFPLLLDFQDLIRSTQASLPLHRFLENRLAQLTGMECQEELRTLLTSEDAPRPVLLIDGWNEPFPSRRTALDTLLKFLKAYPRVIVAITSRFFGDLKEDFDVLDVQPLSESEIRLCTHRLLSHFHGRQESIVQRETEHLVSMFASSPELASLARSPHFLTMMLHITRLNRPPSKPHLLYERCLESFLTSIPAGGDAGRNLSALASLASVLQQDSSQALRAVVQRTWNDLVQFLPRDWPEPKRHSFLTSLTDTGGLLALDENDILAFRHLCFQEYLAARHLHTAVQETNGRIEAFLERLDEPLWWETLRLWAALLEDQDREGLDAVLEALLDDGERGLVLTGIILAEGLGTDERFDQWSTRFLEGLGAIWPSDVEACSAAWSASRHDGRRKELRRRLSEKAPLQSWLGWLRYEQFLGRASLLHELPKPSHVSGSLLLDQLFDSPTYEQSHVAAGRVLCGGPGMWPADLQRLGLLQVWPAQSRSTGTRLQLAQTCGAGRADLQRIGRTSLVPASTREDYLKGAPDWARSLARDWARHLKPGGPLDPEEHKWRGLAHELARNWALDWIYERPLYPAEDWARYWTSDWSGERARKWAFDWALYLSRGWAYPRARDTAPSLSFDVDLESPWGKDFALGESLSMGRASTRVLLVHSVVDESNLEHLLLSEACRLSLYPGQDRWKLENLLRQYSSSLDPLWPALARHLARYSTPEDRALLIDLARHPEKRQPPLSWGLRFIVRGDVMLNDGSVVTLDELADELGLPPLPHLEDMPDELSLD